MSNIKRVFKRKGKPFYSLGGQSKNSSGYNEVESEAAFKVVKLLHGNTLEIPIYWNQVESEEGNFDFTTVDMLLASARRNKVNLILLWFATWKNGTMDYTPTWVKTNPQRFKRVMSPTGKTIWVLSSHCQANFEADAKAFVALCNHLKLKDDAEGTVIALQVENEPGILGSDRDYGIEAQTMFDSPAPNELVAFMKAVGKGRVYDLWQQAGGKTSGTWAELFGWSAGELMSAWSIANYIDRVAEAGKATYDIPMYINAWQMEHRWHNPGEDYPSGGAVRRVLDIYKWFTPHIDLIAPDIYIGDSKGYESICASYSRTDNPFFVPESGSSIVSDGIMFRAIAEYNAIGYHVFGIEHILDENGSVRPRFQKLVDNFRCVAAMIPLLLEYQGTGKIQSIFQEEGMLSQLLDFDGYQGLIQFDDGLQPRISPTDWRHHPKQMMTREDTPIEHGRGLVIQASRNEFYLVGANCRLFLRPKLSPDRTLDVSFVSTYLLSRLGQYLNVDEGHFDQKGKFVVDRQRNGDETDYGLWVEPDIGVLRVIMYD